MVKCLTQEHNMLVTAGFEPATFGLRVNSFIRCATHTHVYIRTVVQHFNHVEINKLLILDLRNNNYFYIISRQNITLLFLWAYLKVV